MSRAGKIAAVEHGRKLPVFTSQAEAERALFSFRDERLALLYRLAAASDAFQPSFVPDSLKTLEQWYFDLLESDGFASLGTKRATFEECMAMYFLETAVRNSDVEWTVDEYVFIPGRYEIGGGAGNEYSYSYFRCVLGEPLTLTVSAETEW